MDSSEVIVKEIKHTPDRRDRAFLVAQLTAGSIVKRPVPECTFAEYFEALMFSTYFVWSTVPAFEMDEKEAMLKRMHGCLLRYALDNTHRMPADVTLGIVNGMIMDRYNAIFSELKKKHDDPTYLIPQLIYNLYTAPLNLKFREESPEYDLGDFLNHMKDVAAFNIRYDHMTELFAASMPLFRPNGLG